MPLTPHMIFSAGARLGPYEILAPLGAGGMGEVYKALDTRLDRSVAIKVLTKHVDADPTHRLRFEREARAISSLNHPHVSTLYDVGEQDGIPYLVVEYIEGETLAYRLARGALPLDQVLRYGIEIADALDHAHRRGFVHRDLKPSNIMLARSGAKLLDFGVAKLQARRESEPDTTADGEHSTRTLTGEGEIVGTLKYMAPEQLNREETDARTDIFAFGAVLYEMLTGRHAFEGKSNASVIAAILERDPEPLSTLLPIAPPLLERIVTRCLAKDPDERWQTAGDLRQALKWITEGSGTYKDGAAGSKSPATRRARGGWIAGGALAAVAALAVVVFFLTSSSRGESELRSIQFAISPPENTTFAISSQFMAVSPDGHSLAFFAASEGGQSALWVRSLDSLAARRLEGTFNGAGPFWSPDSRLIGFRGRGFQKIEVGGGLPQTITETSGGEPGTWSPEDVIVGRQSRSSGLYRVPSEGGAMTPVTSVDESLGETGHSWPQFLPDGRHFLYLAYSRQPENDSVLYVGSLDSTSRVRLFQSDSNAVYAPPGYLMYMRGNVLIAQPFDARALHVTGEPIPIADGVERNPDSRRGTFSVSQNGVLAYRTTGDTELVWFDRSGQRLEKVGSPGRYSNPALSPDEQQLAVAQADPQLGTRDIWLLELARGGASRLTFDPGTDDMPVWSPDGRQVAFKAGRNRTFGFYQKSSSGSGQEELMVSGLNPGAVPYGWSRDGKLLVYSASSPSLKAGEDDLWLLPWAGDRKPVPILQMPFSQVQGAISPDGHWIAYVSGDSGRAGRDEVYVSPFPSGDGKRQVSVNGGVEPQWRRDGNELFFLAANRDLMAVEVKAGSTLTTGTPTRLFGTTMSNYVNLGYDRNQYVVTGDGSRFLIKQNPSSAAPQITVVVNWPAALKQ